MLFERVIEEHLHRNLRAFPERPEPVVIDLLDVTEFVFGEIVL